MTRAYVGIFLLLFVLPLKYIGIGIFHLVLTHFFSYCVSESESFSKLIHFPSLEGHCLLGGGPACESGILLCRLQRVALGKCLKPWFPHLLNMNTISFIILVVKMI